MPMDERVPIRRAVIGFLLILGFVVVLMALVRPAIFTLAPPRDDASVAIGTATDVTAATGRHEILLSRSYGWAGERDAGDGRVQVEIIAGPTTTGIAAVNGASPVREDCDVTITADRLVDCDGRAWTFAGLPLDSDDPPLERFPIRVDAGSVLVDFTRTIDD
ncbi:MAG TPA: hypothetical protein VM253_03495 [Candidatus Limnocylindrales bacterium]|jgi:hypothetical protein|nr:hypothetical protein [Candidatus Limnocylindrales bacterium]